MSPRTPFLSRLIGLYAILIALSMFSRGQATVETVAALLQNPSMVFVLGVVMLAAGLAMVLAHNIWSGGALVVVVTLVGWMTLIKSLVFYSCLPRWRPGCFLSGFTTSSFSISIGLFRSSSAST
jgi:putative exporter of polyketide antibiotics